MIDVEAFRARGYLVVPGVLRADELVALRARMDGIERALADGRAAGARVQAEGGGAATVAPLRKIDEPARWDEAFLAVAADARLLAVARALTGPGRIALYSDQVFMKPARCGSEKPLHQDNSYFRVDPVDAAATCWLAVDDATTENGCLRYIPGSHRRGLLKHKALSAAHLTPDVDAPLGEEIATPVAAGSAIFHHVLTLHASGANRSDRPRRAYALHYVNRDRARAAARSDWIELA